MFYSKSCHYPCLLTHNLGILPSSIVFLPGSLFCRRALQNCEERARLALPKKSLKKGLPIRCDLWNVERMRYRQTNRPSNQPTDGHSQLNRGAMWHLKINVETKKIRFSPSCVWITGDNNFWFDWIYDINLYGHQLRRFNFFFSFKFVTNDIQVGFRIPRAREITWLTGISSILTKTILWEKCH